MLSLWLALGLTAKKPAPVVPDPPAYSSSGASWRPHRSWSDEQRRERERQALITNNNTALIFALV